MLQHGAAMRAACTGIACAAPLPLQQLNAQMHAMQRNFCGRGGHDDESESATSLTIPWVRSVISGVGIMRHPKYNKGLAFSDAERDRLHLRGLLPPAILSLATQMERVMINVRMKVSDLERYSYLQSLFERNENLYHRVIRKYIAELLPIVHLPTVRQACNKYGLMFKSLPRSLFLTPQDRGTVRRVLKNWPERRVKIVMITDGEQVGPAGDLGVHAVNAAIAKLSLVTSVGGVAPSLTLPVLVDFGTNNEELLKSQFYVGLRHRRITGDAPDELMHELMDAIETRFGKNVMVLFEDMRWRTAERLLSQYSMRFPCFCDDFQGLATASLAAILGAQPETGVPLDDHRVLIVGDGASRIAIAELLARTMAAPKRGMLSAARRQIFMADHVGLVTGNSAHGELDSDEARDLLLYAKDAEPLTDLTKIVEHVRPTILISCAASPRSMRPVPEAAIRAMAVGAQRPVILALSSPTPELSAAQAYHWSDGKAMYANFEGAQEEVLTPDGHRLLPSKVQSVYIFPGLALGTIASRSMRIKEEQLIAAAETVASMVSDEDRILGRVLPPFDALHDVAKKVAKTIARKAYEYNLATALPKPVDLDSAIEAHVFEPAYDTFANT